MERQEMSGFLPGVIQAILSAMGDEPTIIRVFRGNPGGMSGLNWGMPSKGKTFQPNMAGGQQPFAGLWHDLDENVQKHRPGVPRDGFGHPMPGMSGMDQEFAAIIYLMLEGEISQTMTMQKGDGGSTYTVVTDYKRSKKMKEVGAPFFGVGPNHVRVTTVYTFTHSPGGINMCFETNIVYDPPEPQAEEEPAAG